MNKSKQKGNAFEYDCQESLQQIYEDIYRTSERGYQRQIDLCTDKHMALFECKRHRGLNWNQLIKFYDKMDFVSSKYRAYKKYLLFKPNRQPCLVFYEINGKYTIRLFEDVFNIPFIKHQSSRVNPR